MSAPRRRLTIVRHAHAEARSSGQEDFERSLDKRGRREALEMAERVVELGLAPDHLLTSPADRAAETAREFAKALGFPLHRIRHDDRIYEATRETLSAILRASPPQASHVMIFGHNPGLSRLAAWASGEDGVELPTAGVYAMRYGLDRWVDLARDTCQRERFEMPG